MRISYSKKKSCRLVGVLGMWGAIARRCLEDLLPDDAHQR